MPKNLELKAVCPDHKKAIKISKAIGAKDGGSLQQKDIYYCVSNGRIKLRIINKKSGELIFYSRPDRQGGRFSQYIIYPCIDFAQMSKLCSRAFEKDVIVSKERRLFLYKNARIHIDTVEGLGRFIEFEVLVVKGTQQAKKILDELVTAFQVQVTDTIKSSYSDLLRIKITGK